VLIQGDQIMRVAVRADWETIGLGVLGALVVLLIGFGALRTVRRKRQEAAEADVQSAAALDAAALEAAEPKDGRGE
jgi:threonine/homoserine/homoserine lactone efflux protein